MKKPPRLATWLLARLGCSPDNEAVLGDLEERYQEGMSSGWYWKQAVIAIAIGALAQVRDHKKVVMRTVVVGMLLAACIEIPVTYFLPFVPYWLPLGWWGSEFLRTSFMVIVGSTVHLVLTCACVWMIVRLDSE